MFFFFFTLSAKSVQVGPCTKSPEDDTKEFEIPKEEEWTVDERFSVCEKYVKGIYYFKQIVSGICKY